jgi:toxin FitB
VTYLLDTNVVSETRKQQPARSVAEWIAATLAERLHISVLTLGEIEQGIARLRNRGDQRQAAALERWLQDMETGFADRAPSVTRPIAAVWGRQRHAQPLPVIDALIAATAKVHDLVVVTRKVKAFEQAGVQVLIPFLQ